MSGEPPCNLRDSWVIPRIQAWVGFLRWFFLLPWRWAGLA
jgi:hypothetical protein